jgi:hypothetical protein
MCSLSAAVRHGWRIAYAVWGFFSCWFGDMKMFRSSRSPHETAESCRKLLWARWRSFLHQQTLLFHYEISSIIFCLLIGWRDGLALQQEPTRSRLGRYHLHRHCSLKGVGCLRNLVAPWTSRCWSNEQGAVRISGKSGETVITDQLPSFLTGTVQSGCDLVFKCALACFQPECLVFPPGVDRWLVRCLCSCRRRETSYQGDRTEYQ